MKYVPYFGCFLYRDHMLAMYQFGSNRAQKVIKLLEWK